MFQIRSLLRYDVNGVPGFTNTKQDHVHGILTRFVASVLTSVTQLVAQIYCSPRTHSSLLIADASWYDIKKMCWAYYGTKEQ